MDPATKPANQKTLLIFFLTALLGGGTSVAVRFSNMELAPFWGATIRFAASGLIFWLMVFLRRIPLPRRRDSLVLLMTGLFATGVSFALLYYSFVELPASLGSVILAMGPLITFFLAILHKMEKFHWLGLLGGLIALTGIALALRAQVAAVPILSVLMMLSGSAIAAEGNIIMKLYSPKSDPAATNALTLTSGLLLLVILSFVSGELHVIPSRPATWLAIAYSVIPGTVMTFYMFVWLLGRWSASSTHYVVMLFPIVSTTAGSLLAGETITFTFLLGGVLVLIGVWVGALMKR